MESFRPQKSPSSDRFLGLFSSSPPDHSSPSFELHEDDIFDSNPNPNPNPNPNSRSANPSSSTSRSRSFHRDRNFGILAALPEESSNPNAFLGRKPSFSSASASASASTSPSPSSSARMIPVAPKPKPDPFPIQQHSAPVNVPVGPGRGKRGQAAAAAAAVVVEEEEEDEEEMMLPPHEIVDRANGKGEPMTTFSVLEGVGRTLKGRDLRRVRNAVWRKTGFLD
ncbi:early nodulin-20-like [Iris pallida]|uniref:Early nodulin-20-like n=1 Tax=Iris pallida TaxID=29817 RepID=A0AAX6E9U3_IRIPA|nr:early nodulin-20-like [Iris pallida]